MPGRQAIGADHPGPLHQMAELHVPVAFETGIRRAAVGIFVDELDRRRLPNSLFHIDGVERHPDARAGRARIVHGRNAAAGIGRMIRIVGREEAQIHADHAVATLAHDQRGDGAIDAATHRDDDGFARAVTRADFLLGEDMAASTAEVSDLRSRGRSRFTVSRRGGEPIRAGTPKDAEKRRNRAGSALCSSGRAVSAFCLRRR